MIWQSWSDFFAMGGYGVYVWGSTVVTLAAMLGEIIALRSRRHKALKALRALARPASLAAEKS